MSSAEYKEIVYEVNDPVAVITLNRPTAPANQLSATNAIPWRPQVGSSPQGATGVHQPLLQRNVATRSRFVVPEAQATLEETDVGLPLSGRQRLL